MHRTVTMTSAVCYVALVTVCGVHSTGSLYFEKHKSILNGQTSASTQGDWKSRVNGKLAIS